MPCEPTKDEVMKQLKDKITACVYKIGEEIVPQTFQKLQIKDGEGEIVVVVVHGRKYPRYTCTIRCWMNTTKS